MPTWANCKNGSTGSGSDANNAAADLDLFASTSTPGYNYTSGTIEAASGKWEAVCWGRAHSYSSTNSTYSYTIYVFAKKLNGYESWGDDWKVTFYYRGESYTASGLTRYLLASGETRLISSHTFTDLNLAPTTTSTIGAKLVGPTGTTDISETITLTDTINLSKDTWTSSVTSDTALKVNTTARIGSRGVRHARLYQYKKASASSYTTDSTVNYVADNSTDALSHSFTGLTRATEYDLRVQFRLRNYNPSDESTSNNPVPLTTSGLTYTVSKTTEKSSISPVVTISGTNTYGSKLTASVTTNSSGTKSYQWYYTSTSGATSGTNISGATSSTYTISSSAVIGKYIGVKVSIAADDSYKAGSGTDTTNATIARKSISPVVTISGTNTYGQKLTAGVTTDSDGTKSYQWYYTSTSGASSGTNISGATSSTYTINNSDIVGKYVGVKVSIAQGTCWLAGSGTDTTNAVIAKRAFSSSSSSVTITGTNKMNGTLTANVSSNSSGTKSYQWWTSASSTATSGTAISGATSSTFKVTSSQIGKYIGVTVTFAASPTYLGGSVNDITSGTAAEIAPTVTAPTMKSSLTYAGSSLALINAGSVTGGTMYYYASTSSTTPTASNVSMTSVPTGVPTEGGAAQTFHVWYKVTGAAGYTDVGVTKIGSVTVNPGTITVTKLPYSGNYNGSYYKASIKVNLAGCTVKSGTTSGTYGTSDTVSTVANAEVVLNATSRANAGTTTVYYQVAKKYYTTVTGSTTITINKVAPTVTAPTLKSAQTYTGSALAYVNAGSVTGGTMYYYGSTSSTTPTSITSTSIPTGLPTSAGANQTYYAWYKVVGDNNHTDVAITKIGTSTTIRPGVITVTKIPYSGTYDEDAHKASVKVNIAGCTVKSGSVSGTYGTTDSSSTTANTAVALGAVTRTNAGSSTVYYQISKSYYATVTGSTTIDIAKAPLSATVTASGTAQYGKTLNTVIQVASGTGSESYQWWYSTSSTATSGTNISGATGYSYTIGSGLVGKYIGVTVSFAESTNYLGGTKSDIIPSAVVKATGSGSVTMNGWTYGGTVPNPIPSSSTNGTSGVSYTWYNSSKTALSAKPTSTSNAGIYYVKATFPAATDYNAYTTDYVGFTVLPSISISASQDYLKGDYGVPSGTISYSLGGGVGSCTNITLTSNNVKIFDNTTIAASGSAHPKAKINTTISYSITYKDAANATKTTTGSKTVSFPYNKAFDYTYSHINASGTKTTGTTKGFVNDGTDSSKQFYLTAAEWNDMNKFLYSAAFRKNSWSNSGLTAPKTNNAVSAQLTATIYNSAVILAEKITGTTYNRVTSGSRIAPEHLNGFRTIINNNR